MREDSGHQAEQLPCDKTREGEMEQTAWKVTKREKERERDYGTEGRRRSQCCLWLLKACWHLDQCCSTRVLKITPVSE
jgi:hypothetical protein